MIAQEFVQAGHTVTMVLRLSEVAPATFYYRPTGSKRGRRASAYTMDLDGRFWHELEIVEKITELLSQEFVDYGYIKVWSWLRRTLRMIVNKKKVYRIMRDHRLLHPKRKYKGAKKNWIDLLVPEPVLPLQHFEFDIKYMPIRGLNRNALLLTCIDVKSRWNVGWLMQMSITQHDVITLFNEIRQVIPSAQRFTVRSDNGSQFVSKMVYQYFLDNNIEHEFTRPASPDQNAHIESYHSILQRVINSHYDFKDLKEANCTMTRFVFFYNNHRIHSGIDFLSPREYLETFGIDTSTLEIHPVIHSQTIDNTSTGI